MANPNIVPPAEAAQSKTVPPVETSQATEATPQQKVQVPEAPVVATIPASTVTETEVVVQADAKTQSERIREKMVAKSLPTSLIDRWDSFLALYRPDGALQTILTDDRLKTEQFYLLMNTINIINTPDPDVFDFSMRYIVARIKERSVSRTDVFHPYQIMRLVGHGDRGEAVWATGSKPQDMTLFNHLFTLLYAMGQDSIRNLSANNVFVSPRIPQGWADRATHWTASEIQKRLAQSK